MQHKSFFDAHFIPIYASNLGQNSSLHVAYMNRHAINIWKYLRRKCFERNSIQTGGDGEEEITEMLINVVSEVIEILVSGNDWRSVK